MSILVYKAQAEQGGIGIQCSDGENIFCQDWCELISFLLKECDFAAVWNIDEFTSTISSIFPKSVQKQLMDKGGRIDIDNATHLFYQPNRLLSLTYNYTLEINIYGLHRYSNNKPDGVMELLELANRVVAAYKEGFGIDNPVLSSPVAAYGAVLDQLNFPRSCDLPSSSLNLVNICAESMTNEWRENYAVGHWNANEVSDVDLCGSYPSLLAGLPDISHATFFESDRMPTDYSWGELFGDIHVIKDVSPFIDTVNGGECYPKGILRNKFITTDQLWLLNKYGGSFDFKHGLFFKLPQKYDFPFKETMQNLYTTREHPNEIVSTSAKGISVGIYGVLTQRYLKDDGSWRLGKYFNSIYGRMVTSRCSTKVAAFIYHNNISPVSVTVDGVLTETILPITKDKHFGQWRLNESSPALVVSQLNTWLADKHPNGLYYADMMNLIEEKPKSSVYADIDLNLVIRDRIFDKLPHNGVELLSNKYFSKPYQTS